jgi:hypothetical protein
MELFGIMRAMTKIMREAIEALVGHRRVTVNDSPPLGRPLRRQRSGEPCASHDRRICIVGQ